ncbi:ABC transporter substrate-binding protein [Variovorax ginsengisoli]|uniref:ABC transporter substrate-binding protein n=1 Tax=Variovorax ginsengisoli TaxID=363844 RepID=A0ABT8SCM4_9BURK|nr:ABC transporter substrate-binding protein [Variovorax ginsengisoli]MDN8617497.1 ABC transporter substrate-binding protein [Variovorax ginsengisoli]MDO1536667.1 ABC transporter substrate-binding protein [Variovorax ginsengisoli]
MKKKTTTTPLAAAALLALAAGFAGAASADEVDTIKARGTLICGTGSNVVPFSYIEDQQTRKNVGYDVDICEAVAKSIGVKPELKFVTTATRIPEVQQGRVDLALASVTITPERKELISFSYPYLVSGTAIITPAVNPMNAFSDLENKRVSVTEGGSTGPAVSRKIPGAKPIGFPTPATGFMALEQGKVQAMAGDETVLLGLMRSTPGKYVMFSDYLVTEKMGIGVRKDEPKLLAIVNQTLLDMEKSGQAQESYDRWFGANSPLKRKRNFTFGPSTEDN